MPAAGVQPDEVSFNTLLVLYGNAQDMDGAYRSQPRPHGAAASHTRRADVNDCPCQTSMRPSGYYAQGVARDAEAQGHSF